MANTKLKHVFGWWDWDAETPALVNRVTGERVAFRGRIENPDLVSSDETWLRFDYLHPELNFPLLVRERLVDLVREGMKAEWTIDYEKSTAFWRLETQPGTVEPPFGAWRRVDDCVTDALACWPEAAGPSEPLSGSINCRSGWLNGHWAIEWRRNYQRLPERQSPQQTFAEPDPWLQPLDEDPPSRWVFHPFEPQVKSGETASLEAEVLLNGIQIEGQGSQRRLVLPADVPLDTLKGRTAYLLTEDGRHLLYPMSGETDPARASGHRRLRFRLIYVDEAIVCELSGHPVGNRAGSARWKFSSSPRSLGLRSPEAAEFVRGTDTLGSTRVNRRLWLKIQWALFDAWSQWRGTEARNPNWLDRLHLLGSDGATVNAGYRGGQLIGHLSSTTEYIEI